MPSDLVRFVYERPWYHSGAGQNVGEGGDGDPTAIGIVAALGRGLLGVVLC